MGNEVKTEIAPFVEPEPIEPISDPVRQTLLGFTVDLLLDYTQDD